MTLKQAAEEAKAALKDANSRDDVLVDAIRADLHGDVAWLSATVGCTIQAWLTGSGQLGAGLLWQ